MEPCTMQLADVRVAKEKCTDIRQDLKHVVAFKEVFKGFLLFRNQRVRKLRVSHNWKLLALNANITNLKIDLGSAQKKAANAEYDRGRSDVCLQILRSSHLRHQAAVSREQVEIEALGAVLGRVASTRFLGGNVSIIKNLRCQVRKLFDQGHQANDAV